MITGTGEFGGSLRRDDGSFTSSFLIRIKAALLHLLAAPRQGVLALLGRAPDGGSVGAALGGAAARQSHDLLLF